MIRGNLPPQAYTREVVANAYNWLQAQPEHIRRMAQNTDTLVALYLRAKRNSDNPQFDEPAASVENFRSQLKNLATEIQQFVPEQEKYAVPVSPVHMSNQMHNQIPVEPPPSYAPPSYASQPPPQQSYKASGTIGDFGFLDPQSLEILKKVRQHLNLGSDIEAMRMLLVLGFEKIQTLFKGNP